VPGRRRLDRLRDAAPDGIAAMARRMLAVPARREKGVSGISAMLRLTNQLTSCITCRVETPKRLAIGCHCLDSLLGKQIMSWNHLHINTLLLTVARTAGALAAAVALVACGGGEAGASHNDMAVVAQSAAQRSAQMSAQTQGPSCEWLRAADRFVLDLSFDASDEVAGAGPVSSLHGQLLRVQSTLDDTRYGTWLSNTASLQRSGAALEGRPGSAVALRVDFETCNYTVGASVWAQDNETVMLDGVPQTQRALRHVATLGAKGLSLSSAGELAGEVQAQLMPDVNEVQEGQAGFVPAGFAQAWPTAGPARLRWRLVAV
jgi:hypothetical protein